MIPGTIVVNDKEHLLALMESHSNPKRLPPLEAIQQARPVGTEVFDSEFFGGQRRYYILHERPGANRRKDVYIASRDDVLSFLRQRIRPERGEGVDLLLTPDDMSVFLLCNHDGEMYLISSNE